MSEQVYTPMSCADQVDGEGKVTKATFSGTVTLAAIDFDKCCELTEALTLKVADVQESILKTRRVREAAKLADPFVLKVDLKRLSDGKEFASWADLKSCGGSAVNVVIDVANTVLSGGGNV